MSESPYARACEAIDRANAADPRSEEADGRPWPKEQLYSRRMADWAVRLRPDASEELRLAARAQHLKRWSIPRTDYPDGRTGYLRWREALKRYHADEAEKILREAGYGDASVAKVRTLLVRKNLAGDPEGQTLEDAACLVFLVHEFPAFAGKTDRAKVVDILRKTWGKMSPAAQEVALGLPLGPAEKSLVREALG